jgi:hypothetical protein
LALAGKSEGLRVSVVINPHIISIQLRHQNSRYAGEGAHMAHTLISVIDTPAARSWPIFKLEQAGKRNHRGRRFSRPKQLHHSRLHFFCGGRPVGTSRRTQVWEARKILQGFQTDLNPEGHVTVKADTTFSVLLRSSFRDDSKGIVPKVLASASQSWDIAERIQSLEGCFIGVLENARGMAAWHAS